MKGQHHDRVLHEHVDPWRGAPIPIQHRPSSLMFPPGPDLNRWGSHPEDAAPSHVENPQPYLLQASQATVSFTSNVPFAWSDESNHFNSAISNAPASINDNRSVRLQPSQNFVAAENPQRYEANLRPDHVTQQPPSNAPRRSRNAPLDWNTHRADIGKFYIDEDNSLEETREKMANGFGFHASIKLYKVKIKEWGFSKYLSSSNAQWMLKKADKRKHHEEKDTEFKVGNRALTVEHVYRTVKRSKNKEHEVIADDAPTPSGVTYNTPRNEMPSPSNIIHRTMPPPPLDSEASVPAPQAEGSQTPLLGQFRITWNGHTRADLERMHHEAHQLESSGNLVAAQNMFRAALDGLRRLLSPVHEQTNNVAYDLVSFCAKHDQMKDGDEIIQWTCDEHIERWGLDHKKTVAHILRIVDIFQRCSRTDDAITLIYQTFEAYDELISSSSNSDGRSASLRQRQNRPIPNLFQRPYVEDTNSVPVPSDEPALVNYQLGLADARARTKDEGVEPLLVGLIAQCEKHPEKLAVQALKARSSLINLYEKLGEKMMVEGALHQARAALFTILNSGYRTTDSILDASVELVGLFVKAGQYDTADTMFLKVESKAVKIFGPDDDRTINTLIRIGMFYQGQQRWIDARPRFEQALAASMVGSGLEDDVTKRLEAALDNRHYETAVPACENIDTVARKCLIQLKGRKIRR